MEDIEYLKKYYHGNIKNALKKLNQGIPVQYIVGSTNFYGYEIKVNKNVLIPRFETEELVEKTIEYIKKIFNKKVNIIDLGTGSGCIAISLKKELNCDVTAVDISNKALKVAKENATNNNVEIKFIKSNMLDKINDKYDVIISNPPYIAYDEEIMDIVKNNEPKIALYADNDGLKFYEEILKNASKNLNRKYLIAFEIGYKQAERIKKIASKYLPNSRIIIFKDLSQKDRFIFITNESKV